MKNIFIEGIATILSILLATLLLICISSISGLKVETNDVLYALVIEIGQMFFPFLIYVIICDLIIKRLMKSIGSAKGKRFFVHFIVYVSLMFVISIVWSLGDIFLSGYNREFTYYIKEFGLFIIFSPIVCVIIYFISNKYLYKYQT